MTKSGRRFAFILVATLANMLLTAAMIFVLILAWSLVASKLNIGNASVVVVMIIFVGAVILSGFVYSKVLKALHKRPDLEERFGLLK
jgi:hypothetical protein